VERRHGVRTVTAMPLSSAQLGIAGVADVVEFRDSDAEAGEQPYPVEYKRGRPKAHRADEVQLCAQALCLEAMFGQTVDEGALFYGTTRRRMIVAFDKALRELTLDTIRATREMIAAGRTPSARYEAKRCDACSLIELCQPHWLGRRENVEVWLRRQIEDED
jgi:CRISPR-associated exonuclease Cas4